MNTAFKNKLLQLYNELKDPGRDSSEENLRKMIAFGARGEAGENYYLFIYRDFYRDSTYYGAVIFFNQPDALENPITIIGLEQNGKEQVRKVYVKAALFFLKDRFQNTMNLSGNATAVFKAAQEKINAFIGSAPTPSASEEKPFDFNLVGQEIQYQEIVPLKPAQAVESRFLKEHLLKLQLGEKGEPEENPSSDATDTPLTKARLGLCLVSRCLDLSGERQYFFQPVIIPFKADNSPGKPQKPPKTDASPGFQWIEPSKTLEEFFTFFVYIDSQPGNPRLKTNLMNRVFFHRMAEELLSLPQELTFCLVDDDKEFQPLKILRFNKVGVRLVPSLKKEWVYRFFLTFHGNDGLVFDARDNYEIMRVEKNLYLRLSLSQGDHWFAVPVIHDGTPSPEDYEINKPSATRNLFEKRFLDFQKLLTNNMAGVHAEPGIEAAVHPFYRFFDFIAAQEELYHHDLETVLPALQTLEADYPDCFSIQAAPLKKYQLRFLPTPVLKIYPPDQELDKPQRLEIEFDYRETMREFVAQHPDKVVCTYRREETFEARCRELLQKDPLLVKQMDYHPELRSTYHYYLFQGGDFLQWLIEGGRKYLEKGFKIYSVKWKRFIANPGHSVRLGLSAGTDWLEFRPYIYDPLTETEYDIDIDGDNEALRGNLVTDTKGMLHLVTEVEIAKLAQMLRYAEPHGNCFWVPSRNYILVRQLYDKKMEEIPQLKEILTVEEKLKTFEQIPEYPLSTRFHGQLRSYQQHGFKWLYFLNEYRFSGCLADDMGLGKTVQTLALLQTLKDNKQLKTSLLVMPVSAIPNWEAEIQRFSPTLSYHRHLGTARDKTTAGWKKKNLILTSYATMRNDIEMLKDFAFDYVILDESQNIKNLSAQVTKAAKLLQAGNRLALSGTPIENRTLELWSLFDFLMPGFLGTHQWFGRQFAQGVEKDEDPGKNELLKKMIYPFMLRRKKQEVEADLPEKIEIVSTLPMEEEQSKLYGETARFYREELDKEIEARGVAGSSMKILEGMLRLRQICLFPQLVNEKYTQVPSVKFDHFKELLEDILAENHKVLVFSQFVQVLQLIKNHCDAERLAYSYIDGSVDIKTREQTVKTFQEDENTRIFLLSLKAGGVALNLTAADYVIIFDPWWNPAVEAQAIDRSHRIGQTRKVMVYRLVVKDSIEEKMSELQERKKALVENLIASDVQAFKKLKKEDILDLFR